MPEGGDFFNDPVVAGILEDCSAQGYDMSRLNHFAGEY